ncbi:hypothetical protein [Streptomyces viridosporus]|uniref:hypothetical protein n=1 Tax=Streptomyces viridosporus TaxID=67581 RepID=UPI0036FA1340
MINALVQLGKADSGLTDVAVADGPEVTESTAPDWLVIGFDGDPSGESESAQSTSEPSGLGTRREEQFAVTVAAIANRGDTDIAAARARASEIGARVEAWLQADPSIGLRELEAAVQTTRWLPDQTEQGASAVLLLTVAGRAFT